LKYYNSDIIIKSIKKDIGLYFAVTLFFIIGLAVGSITVKVLDLNAKKELVLYLNRFFQIMDKESIKNINILYLSIKNNFQIVFFIWFLSITVIGIPVTLFVIAFRGFILGFSVAFFIEGMGWKGLLLTIFAILPQNIVYIPCILGIAALSLKFSLNVLKRNLSNGVVNQYKNSIFNYTMYVGILFFIMCLGSLVEAYLSPILIKAISGYIIMQ
jgi:stage II sporulation protein M